MHDQTKYKSNGSGHSIFYKIAVWSEFSNGTLWVVNDPSRVQADSEDSGQPLSFRWVHMQSCRKCLPRLKCSDRPRYTRFVVRD